MDLRAVVFSKGGGGGGSTPPVNYTGTNPASVVFTVRAAPAQAANIMEIKDAGGATTVSINAAGGLIAQTDVNCVAGAFQTAQGTANRTILGYDGIAAGYGPAVTFGVALDTTIRRTAAGVLQTSRLKSQATNEAATASAGAGAALPATVQGYIIVEDSGGTARKVPYYAT